MAMAELLPHDEEVPYSSANSYQRKVGSALYAAVITRPDVAFAVSRLTRFNLSPGPDHHAAIDRVIEYLLSTATYALKLGGGDAFTTWSDASFADNTRDRKSSQGFAMQLFGGTIGWRANKQDTVTTSTTEAELLALAQATKEAMFAKRLLTELGVSLDDEAIQLYCDNTQTIGLVTKEIATLQTKLRHVDIHNHWLREAAQKKLITVRYAKSADMVADGLTKALGTEPFKRFREMIGVVNVSHHLERRDTALPQIDNAVVEDLEDQIEGGYGAVESEEQEVNTKTWPKLAILYGSLASTSRRRLVRLRGCVEQDGHSWEASGQSLRLPFCN